MTGKTAGGEVGQSVPRSVEGSGGYHCGRRDRQVNVTRQSKLLWLLPFKGGEEDRRAMGMME